MPGLSLASPYPDESIASVLSRSLIYNGVSPKRLMWRATGAVPKAWSPLLPMNIVKLADAMNIEPAKLLHQHTAFPYLTAFMSAEDAVRIEQTVLRGSGEAIRSVGSLLRGVCHALVRPRFCPECARQQLGEFGESCWRRSHNLPTMHICLEHKVSLVASAAEVSTASQYLSLPLPHRQRDTVESRTCPEWALAPLAQHTIDTLLPHWRRKATWSEDHRMRALGKNYLMLSGDVAGACLSAALVQAYGSEYLGEIVARSTSLNTWPALMVREKPGVPFSAVKHILLTTFLQHGHHLQPVFVSSKPGPVARDYRSMDRVLAEAVMKQAAELLASGERSTVKDLLMKVDGWQAFRHQREQFPLTEAQLTAFKRTDCSDRKTGGRAAHANRLAAVAAGKQKPPKAWSQRLRSSRTGPGASEVSS